MNPRGQGVDDDLVNLGLILIAAVGVIAAILRLAGSTAAWLSGARQPSGGWEAGFRVLSQPGDPAAALGADGLAAWVYWLVLVLMVAAVVASALSLWRRIGSMKHTTSHDPRRLAGVATARDVRAVRLTEGTARRAAETLRPSLDKPKPSDVGYLLGRSRGQGVWASVEDSILLVGPPRTGKGLHLVIPGILDAPGPVVATSTRPDNLTVTMAARAKRGPVAVFDPLRLTDGRPGWPGPRSVAAKPHAPRSSAPPGWPSATGSNGGVEWRLLVRARPRPCCALLHAAALDHYGARDLYRWPLPVRGGDAVAILSSNPKAAPGWADSLGRDPLRPPHPRLGLARGPPRPARLGDPDVLAAVTPNRRHFDPDTFLTHDGTLYVLATGAGPPPQAPWSPP